MKKWLIRANIYWPLLTMLLIGFCKEEGTGQVTVFSDDFSTNTNSAWTTSGTLGASAWEVFRSGDDWGGRRNTSPLQLELTNDVGANANLDGYVFASTPTVSFGSPYSTILDQGGVVSWSFNMRQIQTNPGGFNTGIYGVAFIIAAESATDNATGDGYAVVLGQTLDDDPVRLVKYSAGITGNSTITNIITSNTTGLTDFGDEYLSIRVIYNPCLEDEWELLIRNDGTTAFQDPLSGMLTSQGTASDNTYTGIPLGMMAAYWQGASADDRTAFFDNVTVSVTTPNAVAGSYGPVCYNDPDVQLMGMPSGGVWTGIGVTGNSFNPNAGTQTLTYTITDENGCMDSDQTTITVDDCLAPPEMRWILIDENVQTGFCISSSDCDDDIICYGLQYTPNVTGTLTSYTTGFIVDCNEEANPIVNNLSCVMTNMSSTTDECATSDQVLINSSGNSGTVSITQGVPKIIHQVCFSIPSTGTINIVEDQTTNLTASVDLAGGGFITEEPSYTPFSIDSSVDCTILPIKLLDFQANRYDNQMSKLSWITAEEVNISHFEIERSINGGSFQFMGRVKSTEDPQAINQYQFIDRNAETGKNYYRLKQFDQDGRFEYSQVRTVVFTSDQFTVRVWPNPVSEELSIYLNSAIEKGTVYILDFSGKQIHKLDFDPGTSKHEILVDELPAGVYSLNIATGLVRVVEKIIVIN